MTTDEILLQTSTLQLSLPVPGQDAHTQIQFYSSPDKNFLVLRKQQPDGSERLSFFTQIPEEYIEMFLHSLLHKDSFPKN